MDAREDGPFEPGKLARPDIEISIEAMWQLYGEINEWIRAQDFKAGVVLAANGVVVIAGIALVQNGGGMSAALHTQIISLCSTLTILTVIISSAFSALCLVPPLREGAVTSLFFMEYIAQHYASAEEYAREIRATLASADANLAMISHQVWSSARSAHRKITHINWSIRFFILSLFFSLLAILFAYR